jgi:hypothetical protein
LSTIHDPLVQTRMPDTLVTYFADIDGIRKQHIERATEERVPGGLPAVLCHSDFRSDTVAIQVFHQEPDGAEL